MQYPRQIRASIGASSASTNMKTNKFAAKRLRMTKNGKIMFRAAGQNHFNAKESSNQTRGKRAQKSMSPSQNKVFRKILKQS